MNRKNLSALFIAVIVSMSVYGAAVWVGSQYIETFQNGFLFGNFNILKVSNEVPEYEDASGNVKRLDDMNPNRIKLEDFESDIDSADFLCGTNLTASNETTAPIRGITSIDIDQGATAASAAAICDSQPITLEDKHQGKFVGVCFYTMWDGNDNEMAINIVDNTNTVELVQVMIRASTEPLEHCGYFNTATDTATVDYDIEVLAGNNNTTLRLDDVQLVVDPLTPTDIYASSEWESYDLTIGAVTTAPTKGTIVRDEARWRRVGDSMEIRYDYEQSTAGSSGSGVYLFPIPSGYSINTNKISVTTDSEIMVGTGWGSNTSTASADATRICTVIPYDTSNLHLNCKPATDSASPLGSSLFELGGTASVVYTFKALVPIAGWSNTSQGVVVKNTNNTAQGPYVFARSNGATAITVNVTPIDFSTEISDDDNLWDGTVFTAPANGTYTLQGVVTPNAATNVIIQPYRSTDGGSIYTATGNVGTFNNNADDFIHFVHVLRLNRGDKIQLRSTGAMTLTTDNFHTLSIIGNPDADELVVTVPVDSLTGSYLVASGNAGTALTANVTNIDFANETIDDANAWSGTIYTAPKFGYYNIEGTIDISGASSVYIFAYINGVKDVPVGVAPSAGEKRFSGLVKLSEGDTLSFRTDQSITLANSTTHSLTIKGNYGDKGVYLGTFGQPKCFISDVKTSGTNGGTATSGSFQTRDLNTVSGSCSFLSLSSNQITLESGSYDVDCRATSQYVARNQAKLRNITDSTDPILGTSAYAGPAPVGDDTISYSFVLGNVNISDSKTFELQHRVETTAATNGWGIQNGFGDEVYSQCKITKVR